MTVLGTWCGAQVRAWVQAWLRMAARAWLTRGSGDPKQPAGWHRSLLLDNGLAVADVVWRRGNEALMVAVTT